MHREARTSVSNRLTFQETLERLEALLGAAREERAICRVIIVWGIGYPDNEATASGLEDDMESWIVGVVSCPRVGSAGQLTAKPRQGSGRVGYEL